MEKNNSSDELEAEIRVWAEQYAREHGWNLNPAERQLRTVIRGLARNQGKLGARYCPCRLRSGDVEKDRALICPCIWHADEVEHDGHCHCNLFFRKTGPEIEEG